MIPLVLNPSGEMQTRPLMEVITLARKRNRKAHNARSAELKRIRLQRMKEERPDEYRAWREREKARLRARYERMKAGKLAP